MSKQSVVRVRHVMKTEVDIVDGMLTVTEAMRDMKYPQTQTLIIDKRDKDDEYGIVLFNDLAQLVLSPGRAPERINLYELMSKPVIHVDPEMDIRFCTRLFAKFGLTRAPVIESGSIIGLVSYADIVVNGLIAPLSRAHGDAT